MYWVGGSLRELTHIRRQVRRPMREAPGKAQHQKYPDGEPCQSVNIDPFSLRRVRPGVVQQAEHTDDHDEHRHDPMVEDCDAAIARLTVGHRASLCRTDRLRKINRATCQEPRSKPDTPRSR